MFDRVTVRVRDIDEARRFYGAALAVLGFEEPAGGADVVEWRDLAVAQARDDTAVTRHLHLGLVAPSRRHVDDFWHMLTRRGYRDDGAPGLREKYREGYYGAFVLDPDGNSIEAVHKPAMRTDGGCIDHAWLRVRNVEASKRFYGMVAGVLGFVLAFDFGSYAYFRGDTGGFAVTSPDEAWSVTRPLTGHAHVAFPAPDRRAVDDFHRLLVAAGYLDSGGPAERRDGRGSYGAFVLDPDGNDVAAVVRH